MISSTTVKISRNELYKLVWQTPLIKLAKDYNLSDVGLRKICVKHKIPTPPAGYWAKVAHGQKPARVPLPVLMDPTLDTVEIGIKPAIKEPVENKYQPYYDEFGSVSDAIFAIEPIASLEQLHPNLKSTYKNLKAVKAEPNAHLRPAGYPCASIHVTKGQLERALLLMDSLFRAFESQGLSLPVDAKYEGMQTILVVHGIELKISLSEKIDRKEIPPDSKKKQTYSWGKEYEFIPTGKLIFSIEEYIDNVQKKWSDNTRGLLEEKIYDITDGVLFAAMWKKIDKDKWDEWRREREEKARREAEEAERQRIEKEKKEALFKEMHDWRTSEALRAYIAAAEKTYLSIHGEIVEDSEFDQWRKWGKLIANDLDPLISKIISRIH